MKRSILLFILFFTLFSCQQEEQPKISFYYWKTIFKLSYDEKKTLKNNQVTTIYIRYFDIDLESKTQQPIPKSPIHFEEKATDIRVVPVIYLKNKVLLKSQLNTEDLVTKTLSYINQINVKNQITTDEIQIDCDWTLTSKDQFLNFIEEIKKQSGKKISATIRLHQIKYYKQTGIPNVDQAVLMYYNMGKIAPDSLNSIYDKKVADNYLKSIEHYPLKLNLALPIYSWAIHIHNNKIIGLISKMDVQDLKKDSNFVQENDNFFKVKNSVYKAGNFLEKNDVLKIETISKSDLLEMANDINDHIQQNPHEIIFYDLDEFNTKHYEKDIFKQVISRF